MPKNDYKDDIELNEFSVEDRQSAKIWLIQIENLSRIVHTYTSDT